MSNPGDRMAAAMGIAQGPDFGEFVRQLEAENIRLRGELEAAQQSRQVWVDDARAVTRLRIEASTEADRLRALLADVAVPALEAIIVRCPCGKPATRAYFDYDGWEEYGCEDHPQRMGGAVMRPWVEESLESGTAQQMCIAALTRLQVLEGGESHE